MAVRLDHYDALLRFCSEPRTVKEIAMETGRSMSNITREIDALVAMGWIELVGTRLGDGQKRSRLWKTRLQMPKRTGN